MTSAILHETFERVLVRLRPDPNQPHSSTAPRAKTAEMRKNWYALRDADAVLRAVVTTNGRGLRIVDVSLPDTMVMGLVGLTVGEIIDHPVLDPAARIVSARKVEAKDPGSDDVFRSRGWFAVETAAPMIDANDDRVARRGGRTE